MSEWPQIDPKRSEYWQYPVQSGPFLRQMEQWREHYWEFCMESGLPEPRFDKVLGCGWHGCVLETNDPDIVIKFTGDIGEANFLALQRDVQLPGIIPVFAVLRLPENTAMIWRASLAACCDDAINRLCALHGMPPTDWHSTPWYRILSTYDDNIYYGKSPRNTLLRGRETPGMEALSEGLLYAYDHGLHLMDFNVSNFGVMPDGDQLILYDAQARTIQPVEGLGPKYRTMEELEAYLDDWRDTRDNPPKAEGWTLRRHGNWAKKWSDYYWQYRHLWGMPDFEDNMPHLFMIHFDAEQYEQFIDWLKAGKHERMLANLQDRPKTQREKRADDSTGRARGFASRYEREGEWEQGELW